MTKRFAEKKLVIASHNLGKIIEIIELLSPFGVEGVAAGDLGVQEPVEDGLTFIANAEIKARAAAEGSGLPALADDSGLVVPVLGGDPGIYSARWAQGLSGKSKDFSVAMKKVEQAIEAKGQNPDGQNAHFFCALSLCWPNGDIKAFEGIVRGTLTFPPKGNKGFGYDPIFIPINYQLTFSEMDQAEKHQMSHRADAFNKLVSACFN